MKNQPLLYGVIGILLGLLVMGGATIAAVNNENTGMMKMMGMNTDQQSSGTMPGMSMDNMNTALKDKRGDEFDKEFLSMMIAHHESAVQMANYAKQYAKRDEIKKLADDIISAQTKEISQMRTWQQMWGYQTTNMSENSGQ